MKNEMAYIKNREALNYLITDVPENNIGDKSTFMGVPENNIGDKSITNDVPENNIGAKPLINDAPENKVGTESLSMGVPKNKVGSKSSIMAVTENKVGSKSVFEALPNIKEDANWENKLYSVFEQGLNNALTQYIKNEDGQNSLYKYYSDFEYAVAEKNREEAKIVEASKHARLELFFYHFSFHSFLSSSYLVDIDTFCEGFGIYSNGISKCLLHYFTRSNIINNKFGRCVVPGVYS